MIRRTFLTLVAGLLTHLTRTGEDDQVKQPPARPELAPEPHEPDPLPPQENRLLEVNGMSFVATGPVLTGTGLSFTRVIGHGEDVAEMVRALGDVTRAKDNAVRFRVSADDGTHTWYAVGCPVLVGVGLAVDAAVAGRPGHTVVWLEGVHILHAGFTVTTGRG